MNTSSINVSAAKLAACMGDDSFLIVPRTLGTAMIREAAALPNARLKQAMGASLDAALLRMGIQVVPGFTGSTSPNELMVRVNTPAATVARIFSHASAEKTPLLRLIVRSLENRDVSQNPTLIGDVIEAFPALGNG